MGGSGRIFGSRISNKEGKIPMERKIHLGLAQTDEAKSLPDQFRYRVGGGFGRVKDLGDAGKQPSAGEGRADVAGKEGRRHQFNLSHALKHVRFTPSLGSAGRAPALNANESQSRFYEGFTSKVNSVMS